MFVLCASRYAAPIKFTLFASLYHIVFVKLAHKICAVAIKALVKFAFFMRRYFVLQIQPRRLLVNPLKFKRLARVKFVNLILPKPPFQLGLVGTGRAGVVAGLGKRRGCTCCCRVRAPLCVQTFRPDPRPLAKRCRCSRVPADRPLSPRRHRGFS